jgi:ribonuclease E
MTRKKIGTGLIEAFGETCEACQGRGVLVHADPVPAATDDDGGRKGGRRRDGRSRGSSDGKARDKTDAKADEKAGAKSDEKADAKADAKADEKTDGKPDQTADEPAGADPEAAGQPTEQVSEQPQPV